MLGSDAGGPLLSVRGGPAHDGAQGAHAGELGAARAPETKKPPGSQPRGGHGIYPWGRRFAV
jgi:hypothetical protein